LFNSLSCKNPPYPFWVIASSTAWCDNMFYFYYCNRNPCRSNIFYKINPIDIIIVYFLFPISLFDGIKIILFFFFFLTNKSWIFVISISNNLPYIFTTYFIFYLYWVINSAQHCWSFNEFLPALYLIFIMMRVIWWERYKLLKDVVY